MSEQVPEELHYTKTHEWVKVEADGSWLIGITYHAQQLLGDLVYVQLPKLEQQVTAGQDICVVESVKAAADVYSPVDGKVVAINDVLNQQPEKVNQQPYEQGWLFRLQPNDADAIKQLLTAEAYTNTI